MVVYLKCWSGRLGPHRLGVLILLCKPENDYTIDDTYQLYLNIHYWFIRKSFIFDFPHCKHVKFWTVGFELVRPRDLRLYKYKYTYASIVYNFIDVCCNNFKELYISHLLDLIMSSPQERSKVLVQVWFPSSKEDHPSLNPFDLPVFEIKIWIVMDDDRRLTNQDNKNNKNVDI